MSLPTPIAAAGNRPDFTAVLLNADGTLRGGGAAASNIATAQVPVTTSATLVAAARAGRTSVTITSTSAVIFYVGATGVTASTGHYVAGVAGASVTISTQAAIYAVGASNLTVSVLEVY